MKKLIFIALSLIFSLSVFTMQAETPEEYTVSSLANQALRIEALLAMRNEKPTTPKIFVDIESQIELTTEELDQTRFLLEWFERFIRQEMHYYYQSTKIKYALVGGAAFCGVSALMMTHLWYDPAMREQVNTDLKSDWEFLAGATMYAGVGGTCAWFSNAAKRKLAKCANFEFNDCSSIVEKIKAGPSELYEIAALANDYALFLKKQKADCAFNQDAFHIKVEERKASWWTKCLSYFSKSSAQ